MISGAQTMRQDGNPGGIRLRRLCAHDAAEVARIFFAAVHRGTAAHYSAAERDAWAGHAPDPASWRLRLGRLAGLMAEDSDGRAIGFMATDGAGLIDLAFVHPDAAGRGVGGRLLGAIEAAARAAGTRRLVTDASRTARPFFEGHGFTIIREQQVPRGGLTLTNYRMEKCL